MRAAWKALMQNIFAHDYAEKAHIARMAMAKGYGFEPTVALPFPQAPAQNTNINYNEPSRMAGVLKAVVLGGLMLASGTGIGVGAMSLFAGKAVEKSVVSPIDLEFKVIDGKTSVREVNP